MKIDGVSIEGGGLPVKRVPFDLRLRSLRASRAAYARLIRAWARGEILEEVFRTALYGLNGYLAFLRAESEEELEARVKNLEERMAAK